MSNDVKYLSGRVKKTPPSQVPADRYEWIKPNDVEPDLGVPSVNNSVAASLTTGVRKWLELSTGLKVSNDNKVTVDETTVTIDTTEFNYSNSDTLSEVLLDLDTNLSLAVGGTLSNIVTDNSLTGSGTETSPLSVIKWSSPMTLTLTGDVTGSVSFDGSVDASITATIAPNSVTLGTDTTGDYIADITAGSYITKTGIVGEGWSPTIAVDATSDNIASTVVARDVSGNFAASIITVTDLNSTSDQSLKTDIKSIDGIAKLQQVEPVEFVWKQSGAKSYGVIAQELERVLPELVAEQEDGIKNVSYIPLIALLIDAVKKLDARVKDLERTK